MEGLHHNMPRMTAIISDIHSNFEALQAVLAEVKRRGVQEILCLGDVVGYGASPRECIDAVAQNCRVCLCGNHDHAVLFEPHNFNIGAEQACYWTRQQFETDPDLVRRQRRWDFMGKMAVRHLDGYYMGVHGSPRKPINEYLFAEDVYTNPAKLIASFERMDRPICFVGHTHVPGVFLDDPYFDQPDELPEARIYQIREDEKAIINVGSVGQPRDRDPRSSFVILHEDHEEFGPHVEFVRVDYDIDTAVKKILSVPELDDFLGNRLYDGR